MKAIVFKEFYDKKEGKKRQPGEVFVLSKDRYEELQKALLKFGKAPWIKDIEEYAEHFEVEKQ